MLSPSSSCSEVGEWAAGLGFPPPIPRSFHHNHIDGDVLLNACTRADIDAILSEATVGQRAKVYLAVKRLQERHTGAPSPARTGVSPGPPRSPIAHPSAEPATGSDLDLYPYAKLAVAIVYFYIAICATAVTMVLVQERVPDPSKYPPLPDFLLDHVPHMPWAFGVSEAIGLLLFGMLCVLLIFHRARVIVCRRAFAISGTLFLLRCCTMLCTSLSVPSMHLNCPAGVQLSPEERYARVVEILKGFGMSVAGVKTCGDLMFSGHTVALTMLNFLLVEYTPVAWKGFHTMTWVLNLFGIFFVIAAHEHYTLDCLMAFYLTSRLFLYYHSMTHFARVSGAGFGRVVFWFPLWSFLEGDVPMEDESNVFELPWARMFPAARKAAVKRKLK